MKGNFSINRLSSNPLEHSFGILRMKARHQDSIDKFINDIKRLNFIRLHRKDYIDTVIRHRESNFGATIVSDGTFYNDFNFLKELIESIKNFVIMNQKTPIFMSFINEIEEIFKSQSNNTKDYIVCNSKEVTLNPSSQGSIRCRQEMDVTGRKYCPWTKNEEDELNKLNFDLHGDISKIIKYFPNRSPDSLRSKLNKMNVK